MLFKRELDWFTVQVLLCGTLIVVTGWLVYSGISKKIQAQTKVEEQLLKEVRSERPKLMAELQASLDSWSAKAERRTEQNNADADRSEKAAETEQKTVTQIKDEVDGFRIWLSQEITKVHSLTAETHAKLNQKIVTTSEVAPVYRQNRLLKRQKQQLEKKKEPSFKLGPLQF